MKSILVATVLAALASPAALAGSYTVKQGDTLLGISNRTGVPAKTLIKHNPQIKDINNLWIGTRLTWPDV